MKALPVLYVLFVAGAFTGFLTPCRTALATRRAARAVVDKSVPSAARPRRRPRVRS